MCNGHHSFEKQIEEIVQLLDPAAAAATATAAKTDSRNGARR
jgi:hypothetical protein